MEIKAHHYVITAVACLCAGIWAGVVLIQNYNSPTNASRTYLEVFQKNGKQFVIKYDTAGLSQELHERIVRLCHDAEQIALSDGWQKINTLPPVENTPYIMYDRAFYGGVDDHLIAHIPTKKQTFLISHDRYPELVMRSFLEFLTR